jgi:hypothetical protein
MYIRPTLVDTLIELQQRGYVHDFNLDQEALSCNAMNRVLKPDEFEIVEVYRFEGMNDPDDSAILYAIESKDGLKGTLVNAYGVYSDTVSAAMLEKLKIHSTTKG